MSCFACFGVGKKDLRISRIDDSRSNENGRVPVGGRDNGDGAKSFTFRDLAIATQNFREENKIGQGGFGSVFKGRLGANQAVAIKQLNREGMQGSKEFLVEVLMLIVLRHANLVNLIGYCAEGDERLLVYEYMPKGSLEDHLFDLPPDKQPLEWNTRIKIAVGAAEGLTYLHDIANPPVIYRDLKAANILLDNDFNPKLSDFGLAKLGPVGDNTHVSTRVMGTYGYCAPDYAMSGKLTLKSDVYSFGMVLLELITGRKAFDSSKTGPEQKLINWARPYLTDRRRFNRLVDPLLQGRYPHRAFHQVVVITSMCLQELPHVRPIIRDVVVALNHVAAQPYVPDARSPRPPSSPMNAAHRSPPPFSPRRAPRTPSRR